MKFNAATFLATVACATSALAQTALTILSPAASTVVSAGSTIVVRVTGTTPTAGSVENAAIITFTKCTLLCLSPLNNVGTILYDSTFNPVFHVSGPGPARTVFQDISVTIPAGTAPGNAQISVLHPTLTSDHTQVTFEVDSVVVTVQ